MYGYYIYFVIYTKYIIFAYVIYNKNIAYGNAFCI